MRSRHWWVWAGQAALLVIVAVFFWDKLGSQWREFLGVRAVVDVRPGWIALAALTVWTTYALLIEAWRRILYGWDQRLGFPDAARVWLVSSLGRYLPGKVWSIAGMALLARQAGIQGWAAVAAAVVMQALALGTGAAIVAGAVPGTQSVWQLSIAAVMAAAAAAPFAWPALGRRLVRLVKPEIEFQAVPPSVLLGAAVVMLVSWIAYGIAFWFLARGLVPAVALSPRLATGVFAAGYIVGLLAVLVPGGLGVREAIFVSLLTPVMGAPAAAALTGGSRVLLTLTEGTAALVALLVRGTPKEPVRETS